MITVSQQLKQGIDNFLEFSPTVAEHLENKENPHAVTAAQVGLSELTNEKQATKEEFDNHRENKKNPHGVTASQVGLSELINERQATKSEYKNHIEGKADRHGADDISYDGNISVKKRIEELVLGEAGGTVYHSELLNRGEKNQHPMSAIENAGEIILFEGVTEDDTETVLTTATVSDFVKEGSFILPEGYAVDTEISVIAAREQGGIIGDRNVTVFRDNYLFARINVMNWFNTTDKAWIKEAESATDNDSSMSNVYSCFLTKDDYVKRNIAVKGASGHRVFWRGIIRIKNILKVEESV